MDKKDREAVKRLLEENGEFKEAYTLHREYKRKVDKLEKKPVLTAAEEVEKKGFKKLKLAMKDKMEKISLKYAK
ncbi:MAG: DUF465 domain-containing protein [Deltaproteobacteria bacterium]|nr:DUF465 domain-containing protein [Deltaproteobacteria bacterium]